jgi:alpha-tubulin suppressor-like RCC1 family protein
MTMQRWAGIAAAVVLLAACADSPTVDSVPVAGSAGENPVGMPGAPGGIQGCARDMEASAGRLLTSGGETGWSELAPVPDANGDTLDDVRAATGGDSHVLALRRDGTVLAWGANDRAQLGVGDHHDRDGPTPVTAPGGAPGQLDGVVELAADSDVTIARRHDGTAVVWGRGDAGQRGTGRTDEPAHPTVVLNPSGDGPLTDLRRVDADGRTLVALARDGTVFTWGDNGHGQLGDATMTDRLLPGHVAGLRGEDALDKAVDVAAGGQHVLALLADGRIAAWGANDRGQLGDGTVEPRATPDLVLDPEGDKPLTGVMAIAASELNSYALLANGSVLAWGNAGGSQIGNGQRAAMQSLPTPAETSDVACIGAGEAFAVALHNDGTVSTWGSGGRGQLASGTATGRASPGAALVAGGQPLTTGRGVGTAERQIFVVTVP